MNESDDNLLREKSWRKLTPAEAAELQAWLAKNPEAQAEWEAELRLTEAMSCSPDAPVPSNFTARVLQAIERESAAERRRTPLWKWSLRSILPKAAAAAVVLAAGLLTYHEHTVAERRAELQSVRIVSSVPSSLTKPEILKDFDTIRKMGSTSAGPDQELLTLMQ